MCLFDPNRNYFPVTQIRIFKMKKYAKNKYYFSDYSTWFTSVNQLQLKVKNFNSNCLFKFQIKYFILNIYFQAQE